MKSLQGMTVAQARRALAEAFRAAELDSPDLDARLLTEHALGLDAAALAASPLRVLDASESTALAGLAERRLAREPVARIRGAKEFWGLALRVTEATLVPRPETETVVEAALAAIDSGGPRTRPLRIADLGTGSGAILLALLSELPGAFGIGTDRSHAALLVARDNADRLGFSPRASFVVADYGVTLASKLDLIVSNPPYIATPDIAELAPEVRHDPLDSLDGGFDGLAAYRAIAADVRRLIEPRGYLVLELGAGQAHAVAKLLQLEGLSAAPPRPDLNNVPRALTASVATMTR